jgi:hypothetical protein
MGERDTANSRGGSGRQPRLPAGFHSFREIGEIMQWGTGDAAARARIDTLTREYLESKGVTVDEARWWRDFYRNEKARVPTNPSADGRKDLMQRATELLGGKRS